MFDVSIYGKVHEEPDLSPSRQTGENQIRIVVRVNQSRGGAVTVVGFSKDVRIIRELSQLTTGQRVGLSGEMNADVWQRDDGVWAPSLSLWITSVD
jgi:hypothetical protein